MAREIEELEKEEKEIDEFQKRLERELSEL